MTVLHQVVGYGQRLIVARTKTTVTLTVACVTTFFHATSALLMQISLRWLFRCCGVVELSHGCEMVSCTSSSMPVLLAAGG